MGFNTHKALGDVRMSYLKMIRKRVILIKQINETLGPFTDQLIDFSLTHVWNEDNFLDLVMHFRQKKGGR